MAPGTFAELFEADTAFHGVTGRLTAGGFEGDARPGVIAGGPVAGGPVAGGADTDDVDAGVAGIVGDI